jgi:hypothetical protein
VTNEASSLARKSTTEMMSSAVANFLDELA